MITEDEFVIYIAKERAYFVWVDYLRHLLFRFRLKYNIFICEKERMYTLDMIEDFIEKLRRNIW